MSERSSAETAETRALELDLQRARDDVRRLTSELGSICRESEAALDDLQRLVARYQQVQQDSAVTQSRIAAIRASNSWRAIEVLRRLKGRWRGTGPGAAMAAERRRGPRTVPDFVRTAPLGVNVAGYLDTESGMGEAARASIRSLEAAGIPVALNNVASRLRKQDRTYVERFGDANPHPFNLVHLNADNMGWFADGRGRDYFRNRYTIGFWFWELSAFRDEWVHCFDYVDEVWAASDFVRESFAVRSTVPVVRIPLPVELPAIPAHGRAHFGLPETATAFLYVFDVSSQSERKNPRGAIEAFRRAAFAYNDAVLVLKYTNAEYGRDAVQELRQQAEGLNVRFLDGYMDRPELCALLATADCYFSPHRSEGFGLTMLESMSLGKPVIATAYSGNMDFMNAANSFLLPYKMAMLERDYGPYMRGAAWADPDLDEAARLLRLIAEHPDEARARGDIAREEIGRQRHPSVTGAAVRQRLEAIRASRPTARSEDE
jgi:glycosyltransferase involved in cell wall biosynthesis